MRAGTAVERGWVAVDDARWRQAHASSVLAVGGDLLVAWFAGTREGSPDTAIYLARSGDGRAWSVPAVVADGEEAHWNPVLAHGPDGAVWLFYKRGPLISRWSTWVRRSPDGGATWDEAVELVPGDAGGRGPVRNPPLLLDDGSWLAPSSRERWDGAVWEAFVDRTADGGRTWHQAPVPVDRSRLRGPGLIQPALWRAGDRALALLRTTEGSAFRSVSDDGGRTWSTAEPTSLPNNNAALAVAGLPGGAVACVHNPVAENWGPRCPLVVSVSRDEGRTWRTAITVEDGTVPLDDDPSRAPARPPAEVVLAPGDDGVRTTGEGEYSYPATAVVGDHLVVTYTWQRRGIVAATIPLTELDREEP